MGRRNNRSMQRRPLGDFRPARPPTAAPSTLLGVERHIPKPGGVPYGKKVRAAGTLCLSHQTRRPVNTHFHGGTTNRGDLNASVPGCPLLDSP